MQSFESLAIGDTFVIDGIAIVFTKESSCMARGATGEWVVDDTFYNPHAPSRMVTRIQ